MRYDWHLTEAQPICISLTIFSLNLNQKFPQDYHNRHHFLFNSILIVHGIDVICLLSQNTMHLGYVLFIWNIDINARNIFMLCCILIFSFT